MQTVTIVVADKDENFTEYRYKWSFVVKLILFALLAL